MLSSHDLARLQVEQFRHDQRNHSDIICLSKPDRLKHYGLHYAKYVGRLARNDETKSSVRTLTDAALVCLSAANTLHQKLDAYQYSPALADQVDTLRPLADAAGRFADACEKIDHLEDFLSIAKAANIDIMQWVIAVANDHGLDLKSLIAGRRRELAERQFYIKD